MQQLNTTATRYDRTTMVFHWLTALLVVFQWLGAQVIDWFPRGPLRVDARSVHIAVGALLAALLVGRILWRLTGGRRLPPPDRGVLNLVAKGTHAALYALLAAMVLLGLFLAWARGDNLFNFVAIPRFDPANQSLPHQLQEWHGIVGYLILGLAGAHAAAALVHRFLWRDGVLGRMLPGR